MHLFGFGTLMDPEVRDLVVGRPVPPEAVAPAVLPGYRRVRVPDETYPALVPDPAGEVQGQLFGPLTAVELERVQFFESFEYALTAIEVRCRGRPVPAMACLATEEVLIGAEPWDLAGWAAAHKPRFLIDCRAYMAQFRRLDLRAASRLWVDRQGG